ncbi:ribonuclease M5 [Bacillus alkalicellulosilyticus]|uniref:ribonuclease M5 n=1 Tax=Alkalihalobacterium alkalicellulosilyticum TaxID=1912214 RepID=UPI000997FC04|nr:ribonuclease M5 [Bacillus alkalicellulosilyticus]
MKIKEVIVVEGRDDTVAIQRAVEADTIETNGSAIGEEVLKQIALAQERRGVIIFTDPDYPGERIRKIVSEAVKGCKHAFIKKEDALSKKKDDLGVENATPAVIREALTHVMIESETAEIHISRQDLLDAGLVGGSKAKERREKIGIKLKVGYANGKQLYKRLAKFEITKEEFAKALKEVLDEEE